jgi:DNA repair protein RecO (recombination protein O)
LLRYPAFLQGGDFATHPDEAELDAAFRLTGHFLNRDVFAPRGAPMPPSRGYYLKAVAARAA